MADISPPSPNRQPADPRRWRWLAPRRWPGARLIHSPSREAMRRRLGWGARLAAAALLSLAVATAAVLQLQQAGHVSPGVRVAGQDLGGLDRARALGLLQAQVDSVQAGGVRLTLEGQKWPVPPASLGLQYDLPDTVARAYAVGRGTTPVENLLHRLLARWRGADVPMAFALDTRRARGYLEGLAREIDRAPVEGRIAVDQTRVSVVPGRDGRQLDLAASLDSLERNAAAMRLDEVSLVTRPVRPTIAEPDLRAARTAAARALEATVIFTGSEQTWHLNPLGLAPMLRIQWSTSVNGHRDFELELDPPQAERYFAGLAAQLDQDPVDAEVVLEGGRVRATPARSGRLLDQRQARADLVTALQGGPRQVSLVMRDAPPAISTYQAQRFAADLERRLASPVTLTYGARKWSLTPAVLAGMVRVGEAEDPWSGVTLALELDPAKLEAQVSRIAAQIDRAPASARFQIKNGAVEVIEEEQAGLRVDQALLDAQLRGALTAGRNEIVVPVTAAAPRFTTAMASSLVLETMAVGKSNFAGSSWERATNVRVGAAIVNGTVVAPGEVFSFVNTLGEPTLERGFKEGLSIVGDKTVQDVGGGICQVSTTLFRAAFWSGLPIIERNAHAYRVGYYEQGGGPIGLDATVYYPSTDFRFQNTTDRPILIQAAVNGSELDFTLHGLKPDWTVSLEGPYTGNFRPALPTRYVVDPRMAPGTSRQVDWSQTGLDATIYRVVSQGGEVMRRERYFSRYQPWAATFMVGPAPAAPPAEAP